jgi:hypothetical protein
MFFKKLFKKGKKKSDKDPASAKTPSDPNPKQLEIKKSKNAKTIIELMDNKFPGLISSRAHQAYTVEGPFVTKEKTSQGRKWVINMVLPNGYIYSGEIDVSKKIEGQGVLVKKDGSIFEGNFEDGRLRGKGRLIDAEGVVYLVRVIQGEFVGKYLDQTGKIISNSGRQVYIGDVVRNLPHGKGEETWDNGSRFVGNFNKGRREGYGEFYWNDNSSFKGEFSNHNIEGFGIYKWPDGRMYEGQWMKNKMSGVGIYTWSDEKVYKGQFEDGNRKGFGILDDPDGTWYVGFWMNSKKEGCGLEYCDGVLTKGVWKNGEIHEVIKEKKASSRKAARAKRDIIEELAPKTKDMAKMNLLDNIESILDESRIESEKKKPVFEAEPDESGSSDEEYTIVEQEIEYYEEYEISHKPSRMAGTEQVPELSAVDIEVSDSDSPKRKKSKKKRRSSDDSSGENEAHKSKKSKKKKESSDNLYNIESEVPKSKKSKKKRRATLSYYEEDSHNTSQKDLDISYDVSNHNSSVIIEKKRKKKHRREREESYNESVSSSRQNGTYIEELKSEAGSIINQSTVSIKSGKFAIERVSNEDSEKSGTDYIMRNRTKSPLKIQRIESHTIVSIQPSEPLHNQSVRISAQSSLKEVEVHKSEKKMEYAQPRYVDIEVSKPQFQSAMRDSSYRSPSSSSSESGTDKEFKQLFAQGRSYAPPPIIDYKPPEQKTPESASQQSFRPPVQPVYKPEPQIPQAPLYPTQSQPQSRTEEPEPSFLAYDIDEEQNYLKFKSDMRKMLNITLSSISSIQDDHLRVQEIDSSFDLQFRNFLCDAEEIQFLNDLKQYEESLATKKGTTKGETPGNKPEPQIKQASFTRVIEEVKTINNIEPDKASNKLGANPGDLKKFPNYEGTVKPLDLGKHFLGTLGNKNDFSYTASSESPSLLEKQAQYPSVSNTAFISVPEQRRIAHLINLSSSFSHIEGQQLILPIREEVGPFIYSEPSSFSPLFFVDWYELTNHIIYKGEVNGNGYLEGKGVMLTSDFLYEGYWLDGRMEGLGRIIYASGDIYEGYWNANLRSGFGVVWKITGDGYVGDWLKGIYHGKGMEITGATVYEGDFNKGSKKGKGKIIYRNGDVYEGDMLNGGPHGYGMMVWADGKGYVGMWEHGEMSKKGIHVTKDVCKLNMEVFNAPAPKAKLAEVSKQTRR